MGNHEFTDAEIEESITRALKAQNVEAVAGLIRLLAAQNPNRAEQLRQTILYGLRIASAKDA